MFFSGLDLNSKRGICDPAVLCTVGIADESRPTCFRTADAALAVDHVSSLRRQVRRRAQGQELLVPRSVSVHGLRAAHLPRELARHRSVPACPDCEALPHGHPRSGLAQYLGRRQRSARLAHLCRVRTASDWNRTPTLCGRVDLKETVYAL